jgi:hypothetical protein
MLPGYARKFGMRGQVRRHLVMAAERHVPVVCYPHRWDSVSFYLQRDDVRAYSPAERRQMLREFQESEQTLVFVKSAGHLSELLRELPEDLEFRPFERQGSNVTSGVVRRRSSPAENRFVGEDALASRGR